MSGKWFEDNENQAHEGSDRFHQSLRESAWLKMEAKLDEDERRRRAIFWWWVIPGLLLLTALGGGILLSKYKNNSNGPVAAAEKPAQPKSENSSQAASIKEQQDAAENAKKSTTNSKTIIETTDKTESKIAASKPAEKLQASSSSAGPGQSTTTGASATGTTNDPGNAVKNDGQSQQTSSFGNGNNNKGKINFKSPGKTKRLLAVATTAGNFDRNNIGKKKVRPGSKVSTSTEEPDPAGTTTDENVLVNPGKSAPRNPALPAAVENDGDSLITAKKADSASKDNLAKTVDTATDKPVAAIVPQEKKFAKPQSQRSRFTFSVLGAADITTVKFKKADKVSTSFGFGVTYRLNKRLSIGTGIGYAKKLYLADSTNYKEVYTGTWTIHVLKAVADCRVIDIPLNLQYLIKQGKNLNVYATAGISSYLMNREDYDYTVFYNNSEHVVNYVYNNENKHFFSILNLGLDFEKQFSQTVSARLSPFAKLPLTGVGVGAVSLESVGLQASLLWTPKVKLKPSKK